MLQFKTNARRYLILKILSDNEYANYRLVDVFDSLEEAEAQKDLWQRIKEQEDYEFIIFEEVSNE